MQRFEIVFPPIFLLLSLLSPIEKGIKEEKIRTSLEVQTYAYWKHKTMLPMQGAQV